MKNLLLWSLLLIGCFAFNACSDEDDPFTGKDNFITSFSLSQDDKVINAVISENEILVTVPLNYSLNGAKANIILSENTTIKPNPADIADWDNEYVFVVTSFNGQTREYNYSIVKEGSEAEGSVILATQDEVDAFGASGITSIKGNLIIGSASGRNSIKTIEPLNSIKRIGYGVVFKSTYTNESVDGLTALETIGGALRIESSGLKDAKFAALKSVGSIEVASKSFEKIDCPKLTEISNNLSFIIMNLSQISVPLLETVGGNITFDVSDRQKDISMLQEIKFPALKNISGTLSVAYQTNIGKISLPELTSCGAITINRGGSLTVPSIDMPKLEECKGDFLCDNLTKLQVLELPSLVRTGSLTISNCSDMEDIILPKLREIAGDFKPGVFVNIAPDGFKNISALTSVGGVFQIAYGHDIVLKSLILPPALKSCKTLELFDCATIENIDVTGIEIEELILSRATLLNLTVKGDRVFKGKIKVNGQENSSIATAPYQYIMPKFEGIKEVGSLDIILNYYGYMSNIVITGLTKVNGDFFVQHNAGRKLTTFSVPSITEITGNLTTHSLGNTCDLEFPALRKVGGEIRLGVNNTVIDSKTISFPLLAEAGAVLLNIGQADPQNINMPELITIAGELQILSTYTNNSLVNLDGFGKLTTVNKVYIENLKTLTSYAGLKNCLNSLTTDEQWVLINNKYMPTLADMKAGKWDEQ